MTNDANYGAFACRCASLGALSTLIRTLSLLISVGSCTRNLNGHSMTLAHSYIMIHLIDPLGQPEVTCNGNLKT
jgi:hypothetical protein